MGCGAGAPDGGDGGGIGAGAARPRGPGRPPDIGGIGGLPGGVTNACFAREDSSSQTWSVSAAGRPRWFEGSPSENARR